MSNKKSSATDTSLDKGANETPNKKSFEILADPEHDHPESPNFEDEAATGLSDVLMRLEEAEEAVNKHQDDVLRVQAEMQNLRRRTEQDVEKAHKFGQERFVVELLGVIDNLERALEAAKLDEAEEAKNSIGSGYEKVKAIHEGVDLTLKSLIDCFKKFSIEAIDPLGEPFDPLLHQAISIQENPNSEPNTVTAVMQKGYLLHGRVIRPAMVMVSK